ncbi:Leucine-rich repeat serine/threonine-protein kinase 2 [Irineochytrium annulatum]|nr:Leucine-rich repeat serine/threonine-protein kinase 2 [Irineochytrium annulatum]
MPLAALGALVTAFHTIYEAVVQKKVNEKTLVLLKDRVQILEKSINQVATESKAIQQVFQAFQELVRRFEAAIQSAIVLLEQQQNCFQLCKYLNWRRHSEALAMCYRELEGCINDLNVIISMKTYANSVQSADTANNVRQTLAMVNNLGLNLAQAQAADRKVNEAQYRDIVARTEEQAAKNAAFFQRTNAKLDGIRGDLHAVGGQVDRLGNRINAVDQKLGQMDGRLGRIDNGVNELNNKMDGLAVNVANGMNDLHGHMDHLGKHQELAFAEVHAHLNDDADRTRKELEKMLLELKRAGNQAKLLPPLETIHPEQVLGELELLCPRPRQNIFRITMKRNNTDVRCIFKAIKPGAMQEIRPQDLARSEAERLALLKLTFSPYFPDIIGSFRYNPFTTGFITEGVWFHAADERAMTLREYLQAHIVEWSGRIRLMRQVASAVAFMHSKTNSIVHGGLTTREILVSRDAKMGGDFIKVIDFDKALHVGGQSAIMADISFDRDDHPFVAPELFSNNRPVVTFASDIFATGTILWELACNSIPFEHIPPETPIRDLIVSGVREQIPRNGMSACPVDVADAVARCWEPVPSARPTAEMLEDQLFNVYRANVASTPRVNDDFLAKMAAEPEMVRVLGWREMYLRGRMGMSEDDLRCVRYVAELLTHPQFPPSYGRTRQQRVDEAVRLLVIAVDQYNDGGAAEYLASKLYGENKAMKDQWMMKAKDLSHPAASLAWAKDAYQRGEISKEKYVATYNMVKELNDFKTSSMQKRMESRRSEARFSS